MKKRLLASLLIVVVAGVASSRAFWVKEPVHNGKKVSTWIRRLAQQVDPDPAAENALVEMGSAAVPHLVAALGDNEPFWDKAFHFLSPRVPATVNRYMFPPRSVGLRRLRATSVLGRIGPRATNAVSVLIGLLTADTVVGTKGTNIVGAPDQLLRQEAANALKLIGIPGNHAAPGLTDLLVHRDFRVRWTASELLAIVKSPFTREFVLGLTAGLKFEEDRGRQNVLAALSRCHATAAHVWPDLVARLGETNDGVRLCVVEALGALAPAAPDVLAALEQAFIDRQPQVRLEAAFALWKNDPARAAPAIQPLVDGLKNEKPSRRRKAARYLGEIGPPARGAIPALTEALRDTDADARLLAARAVARVDPDQADLVIPILRDALLDHGPRRRSWSAAQILGDMGPRARVAVPALAGMIDDPFPSVAAAAADALEKIEPGLLEKLRGDPRYKRELLMPELIHALKGSPEMRGFAFQSLKKFGPVAQEVVPDMIGALEQQDLKNPKFDWVWLRALDAFAAIGPAATNAVPLLVDALDHGTVAIRSSAAAALGKIGPRSQEVMPALIKALEDDEPVVRAYAARALGAFGPDAKVALPALEKALQSEELQLHAAAMAEAIRKIAPQTPVGKEEDQRAVRAQPRIRSSNVEP